MKQKLFNFYTLLVMLLISSTTAWAADPTENVVPSNTTDYNGTYCTITGDMTHSSSRWTLAKNGSPAKKITITAKSGYAIKSVVITWRGNSYMDISNTSFSSGNQTTLETTTTWNATDQVNGISSLTITNNSTTKDITFGTGSSKAAFVITYVSTGGSDPSPVDPTITFSNGAYTVGGSALDLSTLFTSNSSGAVTYTVKNANGTGATVAGSNFTATTAGTATVTASQAAATGYNAKAVDATITVSAAAPTPTADFSMTMPSTTPSALSHMVVSGGSLTDNNSSTKALTVNDKGVNFPGSAAQLLITLNKTIQVGTVVNITYKNTSSDKTTGLGVYDKNVQNAVINFNNNIASSETDTKTYTFTASNTSYIGSNKLVITRNGGSGGLAISEITITNLGAEAQTYTITYDMNGHGDQIAQVASATNLPNPLPTPSASGWNFGGWYTNSGLTSAAVAGAAISANTTLYAKWTAEAVDPVSVADWDQTYSNQTNGKKGFTYEPTIPASAGAAMTFEKGVRYSKFVINSRINQYGESTNSNNHGFGVFTDAGAQTTAPTNPKKNIHYVPGFVAEGILEAVDYYRTWNETGANASFFNDVKPWFYAAQNWGITYDMSSGTKAGDELDGMSSVKIYSLLKKFAINGTFPDGSKNTNASTQSASNSRFADALTALKTYNTTRVITSQTNANAAGGWWHKSTYDNEMWCDGQYMGPATLAHIINDGKGYTKVASSGTDWDLITNQINISWNYLWNSSDKLLYHGFSATPSSDTWATVPCSYDNTASTNPAYWARGNGWYVLALVEILQQMDRAGQGSSANATNLKGKLNSLVDGIVARQDATSGVWYQVINKKTELSNNYLESSASAIFLTAIMRAQRLGYLTTNYTSQIKKGYEGFVNTFLASDGNGGINVLQSSCSASLKSGTGTESYYATTSGDPRPATSYTEGKALGAFIMAAVEYERLYLEEPTAGYTITYDANGVGTNPTTESNKTALPSTLPTPSNIKSGFTFEGWYSDAARTQAVTAGAIISANTTLYANYTLAAPTYSPASGEQITVNTTTVTITAPTGTTIYSGWGNGEKSLNDLFVDGKKRSQNPYETTSTSTSNTVVSAIATYVGNDGYVYKSAVSSATYTVSSDAPAVPATPTSNKTEGANLTQGDAITLTMTGATSYYAMWSGNDNLTKDDVISAVGTPKATTGTDQVTAENSVTGTRYLYVVAENASGTSFQKFTYNIQAQGPGTDVVINYANKTANTTAGYTVAPLTDAFSYSSNTTAHNIYYKGTANSTNTISIPSGKKVTQVVFNLFADGTNSAKTQKLTFNGGTPENVTLAARKDNLVPTTVTKSGLNITGAFTYSIDYAHAVEMILTVVDTEASSGYLISYQLNGNGGTIPNATEQTNLPDPLPNPTFIGTIVENGNNVAAQENGYPTEFLGWFTDAEFTNAAEAGAAISANTTLYAKWSSENVVQLAYNANGADSGDVPAKTYHVKNTKITVQGQGNLVKAGYTFGGWQISGTGTAYNEGAQYTMANNYTLKAKWDAIVETKYTVTFNGNGHGTAAEASLTQASEGAAITLPSLTPASGSYQFKGWATTNDAVNATLNAGAEYTPSADETLYAVYYYKVNVGAVNGTATAKYNNASGAEFTSGIFVPRGTVLYISGTPTSGYQAVADRPWGTATSSTANPLTTSAIDDAKTYTFTCEKTGGEPTSNTYSYFKGVGSSPAITATLNETDLQWESTGMPNSTSNRSLTFGDTNYTKYINYGGKASNTRNVTITVPEGYVAKFTVVGCTHDTKGSGEERSIFISKTLKSTLDTSIAYATTTSQTLSGMTSVAQPAGTYYLCSTASTDIFEFTIEVSPALPELTITTQPKSAAYSMGGSPEALTVVAKDENGSTDGITYQWYRNSTESTTNADAIAGATSASYTPVLEGVGSVFYFVKAMKDNYADAVSNIAAIKVRPAAPTVTPAGGDVYANDPMVITLPAGATKAYGKWSDQETYQASTLAKDANSITFSGTTANGSICPSTGTRYFHVMAVVNGVESVVASYEFNVQAQRFDMIANTEDALKGTAAVSVPKAQAGESVTFTATPQTGYVFLNWTDDLNGNAVVSTAAAYTITVAGKTSYTAHFKASSSTEETKKASFVKTQMVNFGNGTYNSPIAEDGTTLGTNNDLVLTAQANIAGHSDGSRIHMKDGEFTLGVQDAATTTITSFTIAQTASKYQLTVTDKNGNVLTPAISGTNFTYTSSNAPFTITNANGSNIYVPTIDVTYKKQTTEEVKQLDGYFTPSNIVGYAGETADSPAFHVTYNGVEKTVGTDFTIAFSCSDETVVQNEDGDPSLGTTQHLALKKAGTAVITGVVTPIGALATDGVKGTTLKMNVTVLPRIPVTVNVADVVMNSNDATYPQPEVTVTVGETTLAPSQYTLAYSHTSGDNNVKVDNDDNTKLVVVGSAGKYNTGTAQFSVTVTLDNDVKAALHAEPSGTDNFTYTVNAAGTKVTPTIQHAASANQKKSYTATYTLPVVYNGAEITSAANFTFSVANKTALTGCSAVMNGNNLKITSGTTTGTYVVTVTATPGTNGLDAGDEDYVDYKNIYNTVTWDFTVNVMDLATMTVALDPSEIEVNVGQAIDTPTLIVKDAAGNDVEDGFTAKWTSSSTNIVRVTNENTGAMVAAAAGTTTVTVIVSMDEYADAKVTLTVNVKDPSVVKMASGGDSSNGAKYVSEDGNLVLTLGGWIFPGSNIIGAITTDKTTDKQWKNISKSAGPAGFDYYASGQGGVNPRQEEGANCIPEATELYNFQPASGVKAEIIDPMFYCPAYGNYVTFMPKVNGTITAHIFQNGAFTKQKDGVKYRPQRRTFVMDEAGNGVAITSAKILSTSATLPNNATDISTFGWDIVAKNASVDLVKEHFNLTEFTVDADGKLTNGVYPCYVDNNQLKNPLIAKGGEDWRKGYVVLVGAPVTYTFDVKAGKTYYLFTYGSKLSFYGASFKASESIEQVRALTEGEANKSTDNDYSATDDGYVTKVSLDRPLTRGQWNSLVLPFSLNKVQVDAIFGKTFDSATPNGTQILYFDRVEGSTIYYKRHAYNDIVAGKPLMIKPAGSTADEPVYIDTDACPELPYVTFEGVPAATQWEAKGSQYYHWTSSYEPTRLGAGDYYIGASSGTLVRTKNGANTKGFRGWLQAKSNTAPLLTQNSINMMAIEGYDEDIETAIMEVEYVPETGNYKTVITNRIYNAHGQYMGTGEACLKSLPAGYYIMNGKKIAVTK